MRSPGSRLKGEVNGHRGVQACGCLHRSPLSLGICDSGCPHDRYRLLGRVRDVSHSPPLSRVQVYRTSATRSVPPEWPCPRCEHTHAGHKIGTAITWPCPRCEQHCITPLRPIRRCQQLHPKISWVGGWSNTVITNISSNGSKAAVIVMFVMMVISGWLGGQLGHQLGTRW